MKMVIYKPRREARNTSFFTASGGIDRVETLILVLASRCARQ